VWKADPGGSVLGGWLYQLDTIAVSVIYAQSGRFEQRRDVWHPHSETSRKRFQIADFMYGRRDEGERAEASGSQVVEAPPAGPV
jgi:hypothetical protein